MFSSNEGCIFSFMPAQQITVRFLYMYYFMKS